MSMHEQMKPGIYIDETVGDVWRKTPDGQWTINGQVWTPFPKALTTLHTVISGPAVSIDDAVTDEWRTVPQFPNYESDRQGHVRNRDTKIALYLCCDDPLHDYYWMVDSKGEGNWVLRRAARIQAFGE